MRNTTFSLKITLDRFLTTSPYLGALTLKREGREFILDVYESYQYDDDDCAGATEIQCKLEIDEDTFEDCPFDLTMEDLLSDDVSAEFWIDGEDEDFEVESMFLFFEHNGEQKSIKVEEE